MSEKKLVSILIPCYNERENVGPISEAIVSQMAELPQYEFEIVFIDNYSNDGTRDTLRLLCSRNDNIKAILNSRNFGQFNSPYYGMLQVKGDCVITMCCDFQDPVDLIPRFLAEWEDGHSVVCAIKANSEENGVVRFFRTCYYKLIKGMSNVDQIEHFTGTGLYDRSFLEVLRSLDDPQPFLRGIVAELGPGNRKDIPYTQAKRVAGKTHNNFVTLFDAAMLSFTSYTKTPMHLCILFGALVSGLSLVAASVYFVMWFMGVVPYQAGIIPVLLAVLFLGSLQIFFIGLVGEYILTINSRTLKRPLVVEDERLGEWGPLQVDCQQECRVKQLEVKSRKG